MCSYVLKGISPRHGSKWAPSSNLPPDKRNIRNRYSLCHTQIKSGYVYIYIYMSPHIYIYTGIYTWLSRKHGISQIQSLIMMFFWPQTRAQFSIVGQCLLRTVFQKTLVLVFPFWLPPHFWEMLSLWADYPHLSLQGGAPAVINWLFAYTPMKTSSIYHL